MGLESSLYKTPPHTEPFKKHFLHFLQCFQLTGGVLALDIKKGSSNSLNHSLIMSAACKADWRSNPVYPSLAQYWWWCRAVAQAHASAHPLENVSRGQTWSGQKQSECAGFHQTGRGLEGRLDILWQKSDFLFRQQPAPDVLKCREIHFVFVFTVNIQEDAKDHQKAAPDVPVKGKTNENVKVVRKEYLKKSNICCDFFECLLKNSI